MSDLKTNEQSVIFQIRRFISFYDVYLNLCKSQGNCKYIIDYHFSKDNTLILLMSCLYSLFDDNNNAQSIIRTTFSNPKVETLRKEILNDWDSIKDPVTKIRHTIGFHTSPTLKGQRKGVEQFAILDEKPFKLIGRIIDIYELYSLNCMSNNTDKTT